MKHYIEIRLQPDQEFPLNLLMNALFAKLHRGLVEWGDNRIGISYPEHDEEKPALGKRLRLHGSEQSLSELMNHNWLQVMNDHVMATEVKPIPTPKGFRKVHRVQVKSSPERLRRRYMRRHQVDEQSALKAIPDTVKKTLALPYVQIRSQSTGQRFRLFIKHGPIEEQPVEGLFNHYGLSPEATIPWF